MERKNTILLTVIAVATLLVAVVGATFAYFTATTSADSLNGGAASSGTTTSVSGTKLKMAASTNHSELDYPGGFAFAGASAQAVKTTDGDTDNYNISFDLTLSITNGTSTTLNYKLYKTTSEITVTSGTNYCQMQGTDTMQLYYDCSSYATLFNGLSPVKTGTVAGGGTLSGTDAVYKDTLATTGTTADSGEQAYYYLVVDYPNDASKDQGADQGKTISASITGANNPVATIKTGA